MNLKFTLTILNIAFWSSLSLAQIDEVSVGSGYGMGAFYKISTGEVTQIPNTSWDIAFSAIGGQDGGVFINEGASSTGTPLNLFDAETTDWTDTITNTAAFTDSTRIYNPELDWSNGAFNSVKDATNALDYGWGKYNFMNHTIVGDKIYIIKKRDGSFLKFQVINLAGGKYNIRYADLDGKNEVTASIVKADATAAGLALFSFQTGELVDIPSDFDLIFTRYTTPLDAGGGVFLEYMVTGVLLAPRVSAVEASGIDPLTVEFEPYKDSLSTLPTVIGHEWKAFDFTSGWIVPEDLAYFVKTADGEVYKIVFLDFEGSGTGNSTLEKTLISTTSVYTNQLDRVLNVFPNPTSESIMISGGKEKNLKIRLFGQDGRLVMNQAATTDELINLPSNISSGFYKLVIYAGTKAEVQSLMIQK